MILKHGRRSTYQLFLYRYVLVSAKVQVLTRVISRSKPDEFHLPGSLARAATFQFQFSRVYSG